MKQPTPMWYADFAVALARSILTTRPSLPRGSLTLLGR